MKRGIIHLLYLLAIFLLPLVSADIYIGQLHSVYNIGDIVNVTVTLSSRVDTSGFFDAYLVCGAREIQTYKSMEFISAKHEKQIPIIAILDNAVFSPSEKTCFFRVLYGAGEARSQPFEISRKLNVEVRAEPPVILPGESVSVSGIVIKDNREPLNGYVEVEVGGVEADFSDFETEETLIEETAETNETSNETSTEAPVDETAEESQSQTTNISRGSFTGEVRGGNFTTKFTIPENTPPGSYRVVVRAFDLDSHGNLLSSGESSSDSIKVEQVVSDVDIAFSSNSVTPGNDFLYTALIYDQAKNKGTGEVGIEIYKPDKSLFFGKLVKAGEQNVLKIDANSTPGYWEIKAVIDELEKTKKFYVEELQKISTELKEGILTITNVGNVPYKKQIEISIGGRSEVRKIDLEIEKSTQFKLGAPDGEYAVSVNDGTATHDLGTSFLTGRAIGIDNVNDTLFFSDYSIYIWALSIVIMLVIVLVLVRRMFKKRYIGKIPKSVTPVLKSAPMPRVVPQSVSPQSLYAKKEIASPPVLSNVIDRGEKQEASVIALKIKNIRALQLATNQADNPLEEIDKALLEAKTAGSKIYVDGDYRIIIFMPQITKSKENDSLALNVAKEIEAILSKHNQVSPAKIEFGIGVHCGMMGIEAKEGKIKFISLDNTIAIVKRVAERSSNTVLLSDPLHKKTLGKLKVEKVEGTNFWELKRTMEGGNYSDFIKRFLDRQQKG